MATTNDITGHTIVSRSSSKLYEENWERIFNKKVEDKVEDMNQLPVELDLEGEEAELKYFGFNKE